MSGSQVSTKPASGFRDFLGLEASRRASLEAQIAQVYEAFGFDRLETPALENLNVLFGSGGQENEKLIFKALKRGEKFEKAIHSGKSENDFADMGLRFDLTVPLCRVVGQYQNDIKLPWKVFHIAPVWRAERPQRGRFREFFQCDVDIIGSSSSAAEIEVLQAVGQAFKSLGLEGLELRLNDRRLINALAEKFGFGGEKLEAFAIVLDKQDKLPQEKIFQELEALLGSSLPSELKKMLVGEASLNEVEGLAPEAGSNLANLIASLKELPLGFADVRFDLSLVRGMGYYTGTVFEVMHPEEGFALGGGGRYDDLVGRFLKRSIPAVGCSIGFERLLLLLESSQRSLGREDTLFVPVFEEKLRGRVNALAAQLRAKGFKLDVYPDAAKVKNQFKFAAARQYRWALIAGEDELLSQRFKLKDFDSGQEMELVEGELADQVSKILR